MRALNPNTIIDAFIKNIKNKVQQDKKNQEKLTRRNHKINHNITRPWRFETLERTWKKIKKGKNEIDNHELSQ